MTAVARPKRLRLRAIGFQWWWLIWVAAACCTFLVGVSLGVVSGTARSGPGWFGEMLASPFGGRDRVTVLAVGVDDSEGRGLADTIIVVAVRPPTGEVGVLSIPRDSRVYIPGLGARRVNAAHSYGGLPLTIETVELLLGIPIDYHIEVDVPGLVKLVDAVGGVDIDVEKRMHYRDRSQHLFIDLQPGPQHLDGEQAMGYVRFRHDAAGDLGRIERQRAFIRAITQRLLAPDNVTHLRRLSEVFVETVDTDLSPRELLMLKRIVEQAGPNAIRMGTLPGDPVMIHGQSMLAIEPEEAQRAVDRILWGQGVAVRVLNGTNISGLASRTASFLEEYGCEVMETGNAPRTADSTLIIDHRASTRRAERVASWLGCGVISTAPDGEGTCDVTVVVGRDLAGALP